MLLLWPLAKEWCFFPIAQSHITTAKSSEPLANKFPFLLKFKELTQPYKSDIIIYFNLLNIKFKIWIYTSCSLSLYISSKCSTTCKEP